MYRTSLIGEVKSVGERVTLSGWVDRVRDHGGVMFVDLRDSSGKVQLVLNEHADIKTEYVIKIEGSVKRRAEDQINKNIPSGDIEIAVDKLEILNRAAVLPFAINDENVSEALKQQYRSLSLRSEHSQKRLKARSTFLQSIRSFLHNEGFTEIETPILTKATPEGARDFLVPSRLNIGSCYALPQSPQLFKQLLVIGGVDKYFQIARCFRDEDLRADRQPEFSQLDIEMAFVDESNVMDLAERLVRSVVKEFSNQELEFKRMTYEEAMKDYGCDKPDISFDMKLKDATDIARSSDFKVFNSAELVKSITVKGKAEELSRKDIDDLTKFVSTYGAKGLAWIKMEDKPTSVISKFFTEEQLEALVGDAEKGDIIFFVADKSKVVNDSLAALRLELGKRFNLKRDGLFFLWVTDFPMFEWVEEDKRYVAVHHPFTSSTDGLSRAYDLVLNGSEIAGGSIRINNIEEQLEVFKKIGMSEQEARDKFSHILTALEYGAPPHGGIAFGVARFLATLLGDESIRDVIPFPKTQKGTCLLTNAPSQVDLSELKLKWDKK